MYFPGQWVNCPLIYIYLIFWEGPHLILKMSPPKIPQNFFHLSTTYLLIIMSPVASSHTVVGQGSGCPSAQPQCTNSEHTSYQKHLRNMPQHTLLLKALYCKCMCLFIFYIHDWLLDYTKCWMRILQDHINLRDQGNGSVSKALAVHHENLSLTPQHQYKSCV